MAIKIFPCEETVANEAKDQIEKAGRTALLTGSVDGEKILNSSIFRDTNRI